MKGILKKTQEGWFVVFDQRTLQDPSAEDGVLPLEPEMANYLNMNLTSTTFEKEKEFEEIELVDKLDCYQNCIFKTYAKLVEPKKNFVFFDEHIVDTNEMVLDDCEEVKNWDSFVEKKNAELEVERLAEISSELQEATYTPPHKTTYKHGFIDGYNKAKETLYTKEQIRSAYIDGQDDVFEHCNCKRNIEYHLNSLHYYQKKFNK